MKKKLCTQEEISTQCSNSVGRAVERSVRFNTILTRHLIQRVKNKKRRRSGAALSVGHLCVCRVMQTANVHTHRNR